ncbi:MAG: DNA replication/repair protein RecF [Spongiibacteraceae bacterium]|jgi:DNA replication and repair protein RecF|nr:DNA replication/repair protein RecF [Spongiibacteraceae bacterium]
MYLEHFTVRNVRNISDAILDPSPSLNLIHGSNGSGKTSLLEALHLLLVGRSFRNQHRFRSLVQEGTDECLVVGRFRRDDGQTDRLGVRRNIAEKAEAKLNGERVRSIAQLASIAPVQVLDSDLVEMVLGPPALRRQLIDWGLFHVEHSFLSLWRQADRALKQRNGALRHGKIDYSQIELWSLEYARYGALLGQSRQEYVEALTVQLDPVLQQVAPSMAAQVRLEYTQGWSGDSDQLRQQLLDSIDRDVQLGQTRVGPHRADIKIRIAGALASDVLSRGQLKLIAAAVRLAQVRLLYARTRKAGLVLVDDLPAELDKQYRSALWAAIGATPGQHFITCIEPDEVAHSWGHHAPPQMFHVEHGIVS